MNPCVLFVGRQWVELTIESIPITYLKHFATAADSHLERSLVLAIPIAAILPSPNNALSLLWSNVVITNVTAPRDRIAGEVAEVPNPLAGTYSIYADSRK